MGLTAGLSISSSVGNHILPLSLLFLSQKNILLAQTFTERVVSICMLHLPPSLDALHWLPNSEKD